MKRLHETEEQKENPLKKQRRAEAKCTRKRQTNVETISQELEDER